MEKPVEGRVVRRGSPCRSRDSGPGSTTRSSSLLSGMSKHVRSLLLPGFVDEALCKLT